MMEALIIIVFLLFVFSMVLLNRIEKLEDDMREMKAFTHIEIYNKRTP